MTRARLSSVGVSTVLFDGYPLETAFAELAKLGVSIVEPAFIAGYVDFDESAFSPAAAARLRGAMRAEGLAANAVSAHCDLGEPDAVEAIGRRLRYAREIGANILITNATSVDKVKTFRGRLDSFLRLCDETKVTLALENPGHGVGALVGSGADGARIVHATHGGLLRLNYDVANVFTYSNERLRPETDIADALGYIAHVHLKDVVSDQHGWRFVAIGEGSLAMAAICALIASRLPDTPITLELPLRLTRPGRRDPVRATTPLPLDAARGALIQSLQFLETTALGSLQGKRDNGAPG